MKSVLEIKVFEEEQPVTIEYLRLLLRLTQKELAALAQIDLATIKRVENVSNPVRQPTAERLLNTINEELHKQGYLSEHKTLLIKHVVMYVP